MQTQTPTVRETEARCPDCRATYAVVIAYEFGLLLFCPACSYTDHDHGKEGEHS